jgi:hypothetical protein
MRPPAPSAANKGTRQIRVILYAKSGPFWETAPADELPVEDNLIPETADVVGTVLTIRARAV